MATIVEDNPFMLSEALALTDDAEQPDVHVYGQLKGGHGRIVCATEAKGEPKDRDVNLNEIVVGINGIIPLWASDATLYYRFHPSSFRAFANPTAAKDRIRTLLNKALALWGDSCPVKIAERKQGWDFEVIVQHSPNCNAVGCVLASAFFPDGGQHQLNIYPTLFEQDEEEQIETLVHELGHVFGLRHFFAKVSETKEPSEIFGTHVKFTIMNYGDDSKITDADRTDLKSLYQQARSGKLKAINGTQIRLVRPFSALGG